MPPDSTNPVKRLMLRHGRLQPSPYGRYVLLEDHQRLLLAAEKERDQWSGEAIEQREARSGEAYREIKDKVFEATEEGAGAKVALSVAVALAAASDDRARAAEAQLLAEEQKRGEVEAACEKVEAEREAARQGEDEFKAERDKAIKRREFTEQWYALRIRRIKDTAQREGIWPEVACILANGTAGFKEDGSYEFEPPTYAQILNAAKWRAEAYRDQLDEAAGRAPEVEDLASLLKSDGSRGTAHSVAEDLEKLADVLGALPERAIGQHDEIEALHNRAEAAESRLSAVEAELANEQARVRLLQKRSGPQFFEQVEAELEEQTELRSAHRDARIQGSRGSIAAAANYNRLCGEVNGLQAALQLLRDKGTEQNPKAHDYLSTACLHQLHERCRKTCKFCETGCRCSCHRGTEQGGGDD